MQVLALARDQNDQTGVECCGEEDPGKTGGNCRQVTVVTVSVESTGSALSRQESSIMIGCPMNSRGFLWMSWASKHP